MSLDLALSARAERAKQLADIVLAADIVHLDALLDRAVRELHTAAAHLSLLTDRHITASASPMLEGSDRGAQRPFDETICANALRSESMLAIPNTASDPRVASMPAVQSGRVAAYLGLPLRHDGFTVAVLCVVDDQPRVWTESDVATLTELAASVLAELARLDSTDTV
jgi:GAF domain-containing protein